MLSKFVELFTGLVLICTVLQALTNAIKTKRAIIFFIVIKLKKVFDYRKLNWVDLYCSNLVFGLRVKNP